jgi:hypothetical protein
VHRVEQPRHQIQPLPLALLMMIKHVLFSHAVPPPSPCPATPHLMPLGMHTVRTNPGKSLGESHVLHAKCAKSINATVRVPSGRFSWC